jgi:chorismate dehydratase
MPTRLGVVSYFNTRPLVHALENGEIEHPFELQFDVPSVCADKLHRHETDVALIPSIEIARAAEPYAIAPGASISSRGAVRSVLLVHNTDLSDIRTIALDTGSRTSVALSRIILHQVYGCNPETFPASPNLEHMLANADAALIIGDAALELDLDKYRCIDLGEAWTELTGLPFVYACWTGREGALSNQHAELLVRARTLGISSIAAIADAHAASAPHSSEFYHRYLSQNIRYDLGEQECKGLELFYRYACELNVIESVPKLTFFS